MNKPDQIAALRGGGGGPAVSLARDGVAWHRAAVSAAERGALEAGIQALTRGEEVHGLRDLRRRLSALDAVLGDGPLGRLAAAAIGPEARPVRSILFDKTPAKNWAVPWHQDRSIAVAARSEVAGFGPWTVKDRVDHVEPPAALLERMVTLRLHLDAAEADSGALMVMPGTQALGRLTRDRVGAEVAHRHPELCRAAPGDVLAMRPLLLHASQKAARPGRRRVIHIEFSVDDLPPPLAWAEHPDLE